MILLDIGAGGSQLIDIVPMKTYKTGGKVDGGVEIFNEDGSEVAKAVKYLTIL